MPAVKVGAMVMTLEGKTALVTGGAVRLGRGIARALAARGVRIALHYGTSAAAAEETLTAIRALGSDGEAFQWDLRRIEGLDLLVERASERFCGLDILINSAAVFMPGALVDTTEELWDKQFSINLKAPFFLCQAFARQAGTRGDRHIINIADWRAIRPRADYLAYTLTKSGIITLTEALALSLAPAVRVNAIAPGAILPPPGRDESYLNELAQKIPLRRAGSTEEVSDAVIYLLQSGYVTGQTLFVDGGEHL